MKFLKLVLQITLVYFFVVLVWLLYCEKEMQLYMLALQAITFGIIAAGYRVLSKNASEQATKEHPKTR